MAVERLNIPALRGEVPGWVISEHPPVQIAAEGLTILPGAAMVHPLADSDYPIALRIETRVGTGVLAVTRASRDALGPFGLPRRGVMFALWNEAALAENPFNAQIFWIDGDRLIPLNRDRIVEMPEVVTVDIYDDGRWVSFAVDGEMMGATVTPDQPRRDLTAIPQTMYMRTAVEQAASLYGALTPNPHRERGDVVITSRWGDPAALGATRLGGLTLLRHVPRKTDAEQRRWETIVDVRSRVWPRPLQGVVRDAQTHRPVAGAWVMVDGGRRHLISNLRGRFLDTDAPGPRPGRPALRVLHPDYPETHHEVASGENLGDLVLDLPQEGPAQLALTIEGAPSAAIPRRVTLIPEGGGPARHHLTPPIVGALTFRHLPAGLWHVEVECEAAPGAPLVSEPFEVTGEEFQEKTVTVTRG